MTAISDHCDTIRSWLNFEHSDVLITSWTRMAEEFLSASLRCKHMIAIDTGTITDARVSLPSDWLDLDFVRVVDGLPLHFRSRDEFYNNSGDDENYNSKHYTITGNYLLVGGNLEDGREVEISYYQTIPPLDTDANWLSTYYSRLLVGATLSVGFGYSIGEEERAGIFQASVQSLIDQINNDHQKSKSGGSRLTMPRKRGFG